MNNALLPIFLIMSILFSCTPMQRIETPRSGAASTNYRVISTSDQNCKVSSSHKRWKILFATYPLSIPEPKEIFPNSNKAYRVYETSDWKDVTISILLGLTTTVTRDSLIVEECMVMDQYFADLASRIPENNKLFQDKLEEAIREEKIKMKIVDVDESGEDSDQELAESENGLTKVWLKSGKVIRGKILNQDVEKVILIDEKGREVEIMKSNVQKIQFR